MKSRTAREEKTTPHTMNKGTLIRYYPNETEHYTAVVTDKGLLQVKPRTLVAYDSLEDWCASLPGTPSQDVLRIEEKAQEPTQPQKKRLRSASIPSRIRTLPWPRYLYKVMNEADPTLLTLPKVHEAFYALVDLLILHEPIMFTWASMRDVFDGVQLPLQSAHRPLSPCVQERRSFFEEPRANFYQSNPYQQVVRAYAILLELIGPVVIPYINHRNAVRSARKELMSHRRALNSMKKKLFGYETEKERHEAEVERLERFLQVAST